MEDTEELKYMIQLNNSKYNVNDWKKIYKMLKLCKNV